MKYIAYYVKGLEEIGWSEIKELHPDVNLVEKGINMIVFEVDYIVDYSNLIFGDDVVIFIGSVSEFVSVDQILELLKDISIQDLITNISKVRPVTLDTFSLTVSESKNTVFHNPDSLTSFIKFIEGEKDLIYTETDHTNFDFRIFIDEHSCYLSIRLTRLPLFHRTYRTVSQSGALKPTIAAAMARLCGVKKGDAVIDVFCGSGTILCESVFKGAVVFGSDIDDKSVTYTIQNLKALIDIKEGMIRTGNAGHTNWQDQSFDKAISNLPWNKQIKVESLTELYISALYELRRIIKKNGVICLLVSNPELLLKWLHKIIPGEVQLFKIGYLGQTPTIVLLKR